jgi:diaminopropionate ammonia-lyase
MTLTISGAATATVVRPTPTPTASGLFTADEYEQMRAFFAARSGLRPTPMRSLPALARALNIGHLDIKDETGRFGLNAFKLLGARFAIETLLGDGTVHAGDTVVCASEGNHGRAVARAAREAGCVARVYMAHDAAPARIAAIAGEGATVITVDGSYDDAVRQLEAEAAVAGWTIVSDTAWPGYQRIPRLIMLGYTRMMDEDFRLGIADRGWRNADPDIVFVQGGVGGLLCGVASWWAFHRRERRPRIVCVEPMSAACLQASARAGRPVAVTGPLNTIMAGLRNREVSPLAFDAVLPIVDAFLAIDDCWVRDAMRFLGRPSDGDPAIAAGASGAATVGGLLALRRDPAVVGIADELGLTPQSRVLAIVSEGVTDPELWKTVVSER